MKLPLGVVSALVLGCLQFVLPNVAQAQLYIDICHSGTCKSATGEGGRSVVSGTAAVGDIADQILIRDANGADVLSSKIPVDPATPLPTPTGWSGPSSPPSTATGTPCFYVQNIQASTFCGASKAAACAAVPGTVTGGGTTCQANTGGAHQVIATGSPTCPAGYTSSSGTCNLSNASLVIKPSDGKVNVKRTGNSYGLDTQDPDTSPDISVSPQVITVNLGNGRTGTIALDSATGKVVVTAVTANAGGATSNATTTNIGTAANSYKVEGINASTYQGVGTGATPSATGGTCASGGGDCASEATLRALKDNVAAGVKQDEQGSLWNTDKLTADSAKTATTALNDALKAMGDNAKASGHGSSLNSDLGDLTVPTTKSNSSWWDTYFPSSETCVPLVPGATGRFTGLTLDMCPVINRLRPILEWALYLMTALSLYSSWMRGHDHNPRAHSGMY